LSKQGLVQGVIFDMDGVLCDSEPFLYRAAREMFSRRFGLDVSREDFAPFVGTGEDRYLGGVAERYGVELQMPEDKLLTYEIYLGLIRGELEPLPGVLDFVTSCHEVGLKTAVATSADRIKAEANLSQIGLPPEGFDLLLTGDDVVRKKPHPEIFRTAAKRLGLQPAHCIVIEDSPSGVDAAVRSGARCLAVLSSFTETELLSKGADWSTSTLWDTPLDLRKLLFEGRS
jgi:HAD superfamily hydrolase (TIGR01509 family)